MEGGEQKVRERESTSLRASIVSRDKPAFAFPSSQSDGDHKITFEKPSEEKKTTHSRRGRRRKRTRRALKNDKGFDKKKRGKN